MDGRILDGLSQLGSWGEDGEFVAGKSWKLENRWEIWEGWNKIPELFRGVYPRSKFEVNGGFSSKPCLRTPEGICK